MQAYSVTRLEHCCVLQDSVRPHRHVRAGRHGTQREVRTGLERDIAVLRHRRDGAGEGVAGVVERDADASDGRQGDWRLGPPGGIVADLADVLGRVEGDVGDGDGIAGEFRNGRGVGERAGDVDVAAVTVGVVAAELEDDAAGIVVALPVAERRDEDLARVDGTGEVDVLADEIGEGAGVDGRPALHRDVARSGVARELQHPGVVLHVHERGRHQAADVHLGRRTENHAVRVQQVDFAVRRQDAEDFGGQGVVDLVDGRAATHEIDLGFGTDVEGLPIERGPDLGDGQAAVARREAFAIAPAHWHGDFLRVQRRGPGRGDVECGHLDGEEGREEFAGSGSAGGFEVQFHGVILSSIRTGLGR